MNKVVLLGRLGQDAELKVTQGGQNVLKFSLATSEKFTKANGEKQEKTQWHRCVMWGERAAKLAQYLTKGSQIAVEGSIEYGSYEKDNVKHYTTDIKVFNVEFAGGAKRAENGEAPTNGASASDDTTSSDIGDEEIPF